MIHGAERAGEQNAANRRCPTFEDDLTEHTGGLLSQQPWRRRREIPRPEDEFGNELSANFLCVFELEHDL